VIWPRLDDFATILLALAILVFRPINSLPSHWRAFERLLLWANVLTFVSYVFRIVLAGGGEHEVYTGLFQSLRVAQYTIVFVCFIRIGGGARSPRLMLGVVSGVWGFIFAVALANFLGWLPPTALAPHLLDELSSAGAWGKLVFVPHGVLQGPLGYSNIYMACQMTLLGVLLAFGTRRSAVTRWVVLLLTFLIVFVSGSRSGLVGFLCALALAVVAAKWRSWLIVGTALTLLLVLAASSSGWVEFADSTVRRQGGLMRVGEVSSYTERVAIWQDKLSYMKENPSVLLLGLGWGGILVAGPSNAHMLPLQILMETGIFGLLFFFFLFRALLRALWKSGIMGRSLAVATSGLLVASLAQEVFYPIPSMGSFLGVYLALCALAATGRPDASIRRGGTT
jgi:hypothetical protein